LRRILFLFLLAGCFPMEKEKEIPDYMVYGIMIAGKPVQHLVVDRIYEPAGAPTGPFPQADVRVIADTDTIVFEKQDTFYVNQSGNEWAQPLRKLSLEVIIKEEPHETLRSTTLIPGPFSIILPMDGDTVDSTDVLILTPSDSSYFYIGFVYLIGDTVRNPPLIITDTIFPIFSYTSCFQHPGEYMIKVYAYPEEYYYFLVKERSNIENGFGVFSGCYEDSVRVYHP